MRNSVRNKGCVHTVFSLNNQAHVLMSSDQTDCTASYCAFHFPQWNRLYSPWTGTKILFCLENKKSIPTYSAAVWNLKAFNILVVSFFPKILLLGFLCARIDRLAGVFMNCLRVMSRWCMALMNYSWGGWEEFQQPDREKLCYWSVSNASGLLTWYLRDSDINSRSALGIILQRLYRDFRGKKMLKWRRRRTDLFSMREVGPELLAFNDTNMSPSQGQQTFIKLISFLTVYFKKTWNVNMLKVL